MNRAYFLNENACIEPLTSQWNAWWLTVAPVPASLHLHSYQVPLLKAYLQTPDFHARAAKDPAMRGSSFVGIAPARAPEVRSLLQRMQTEQEDRLQLAAALESFQDMLLLEAKGQSLEPFYARLPAPLQGRVELVYDYLNRPAVRVIEGLFYRSRYHKPQLQSLRLSLHESDAGRPSMLCTPRLLEEGQIDWPIEFSSERVDQLFTLDHTPRPLGEIRELLGLPAEREPELLRLLTEEPPPPPSSWPEDSPGPRVRYLGHACALVEWRGKTILLDPMLSPRPTAGGMERISYRDLPPRIDYALITHNHTDHFIFETLLRLRHRLGTLVLPRSHGILFGDCSLRMLCQSMGFKHVVELDSFDSLPLPDGDITAVPFLGEHGDLDHPKASYVIRAGQQRMLFAADSACLDEQLYRNVRQSLGDIGTVFMNTETEGSPLAFTIEALLPKRRDRKLEKARRCRGSNASEGMRALELLGARRFYNYAMGLEPWVEHIIGPPSPPEAPRMKESDALMRQALERGLAVAERLCGPKDLLLLP